MPATIRVAIIEDHPVTMRLLEGVLKAAENIEVCGCFGSGEEAVRDQNWGEVDVALVDLELPGMSGVKLIGWLQENAPRVKAVAYTGHANEEVFFSGLRAGAAGFILKDGALAELPGQLWAIRQGGSVLSPAVASSLVQAMVKSPQAMLVEPLTQRELALLKLFADGLRYKEAAEELSISPNTVHAHASRIYAKLNVSKRREAIRVAQLAGLI